jgi:hypothetical protein
MEDEDKKGGKMNVCEKYCRKCDGCGMCGRTGGMGFGGCGCGYFGRHHMALWIVLRILAVILIFWAGFALGQLVGYVKAEFGYGTHGGYGMMRTMQYGTPSGSNYFIRTLPGGEQGGTSASGTIPAPSK